MDGQSLIQSAQKCPFCNHYLIAGESIITYYGADKRFNGWLVHADCALSTIDKYIVADPVISEDPFELPSEIPPDYKITGAPCVLIPAQLDIHKVSDQHRTPTPIPKKHTLDEASHDTVDSIPKVPKAPKTHVRRLFD